MIRLQKSLYRLFLVFAWTLFEMVRTLPLRYQKDRERSMRDISVKMLKWSRVMLKILKIRVCVHGDLNAYRKNGGLIVSNHMGYMDIIVHASLAGMRFQPKSDIRKWPVIGEIVEISNPIWVDRRSRQKSREALEEFRRTLKARVPLIVYPEGTSTDGFHGILPFKGTAFETVVGTQIPVQPIVTMYTVQEGDMNPAWFGDQELIPHMLKVFGNRQITANVFILPLVRAENMDRKELAEKVHKMMEDVYAEEFPKLGERSSHL